LISIHKPQTYPNTNILTSDPTNFTDRPAPNLRISRGELKKDPERKIEVVNEETNNRERGVRTEMEIQGESLNAWTTFG
jgi:hypothetical protein